MAWILEKLFQDIFTNHGATTQTFHQQILYHLNVSLCKIWPTIPYYCIGLISRLEGGGGGAYEDVRYKKLWPRQPSRMLLFFNK